jgi:hypothetical protein
MESRFQSNTQVVHENLVQVLDLLAANGAWLYSVFGQDDDESSLAYL